MFKRLSQEYQQNAAENKHLLCEKFYKYKCEQGSSIMSHISAVETMANQLKDLGVGIDETQLITKIIMTLPPSYGHFVNMGYAARQGK